MSQGYFVPEQSLELAFINLKYPFYEFYCLILEVTPKHFNVFFILKKAYKGLYL